MASKGIPLLRTTVRPLQRTAQPIQIRSLFGFPSPFVSSSLSSSSSSSTGTASLANGTLTKSGSLSIYEESREMGYDPQQLYSIIADVDAYKSFLPFTTESRILSASITPPPSSNLGKQTRPVETKEWLRGGEPGEVWDLQGELQVGAMGYQEAYVSHVRAKKWNLVSATANNSNIFKHLETKWSLTPLPTRRDVPRTKVDLYIAYSFISPFHAAAVSALWEKVSGLMIDGFEKRVKTVYGPSRPA